MNQLQDLPAAQGDTGGAGKSRGGIPFPMEWIMEWLVNEKHTNTFVSGFYEVTMQTGINRPAGKCYMFKPVWKNKDKLSSDP